MMALLFLEASFSSVASRCRIVRLISKNHLSVWSEDLLILGCLNTAPDLAVEDRPWLPVLLLLGVVDVVRSFLVVVDLLCRGADVIWGEINAMISFRSLFVVGKPIIIHACRIGAAYDPGDEVAALVTEGASEPGCDGCVLVVAAAWFGFGVGIHSAYALLRFDPGVTASLERQPDVVDKCMLVYLVAYFAYSGSEERYWG